MKGGESYMAPKKNTHVRLKAVEIASETLVQRLILTDMSDAFLAFGIEVFGAHNL